MTRTKRSNEPLRKHFQTHGSTPHQVLRFAALMLTTFLVTEFFIAYLLHGITCMIVVALVIAFISDARSGEHWSANRWRKLDGPPPIGAPIPQTDESAPESAGTYGLHPQMLANRVPQHLRHPAHQLVNVQRLRLEWCLA